MNQGLPRNWIQKNVYYLFILIISIFTAVINIGGPYTIHFIDILWPIRPLGELRVLFNFWSPYNYGGNGGINLFNAPVFILPTLLSEIPSYIQEIIIISLLQFIGGFYIFKLFRELLLEENMIYANIISLAATFPIIFDSIFWYDFFDAGFLFLAFSPIFLYYSMKLTDEYLGTGKLTPKYVIFIIGSGALSFSANVPFNESLVVLALVMPLFVVIKYGLLSSSFKVIKTYMIIISCAIFGNLWWGISSILAQFYYPNILTDLAAYSSDISIFNSSTKNTYLINLFQFGRNISSDPYLTSGNIEINKFLYIVLGGYLTIILLIVAFVSLFLSLKLTRKFLLSFLAALALSLLMLGVSGPLNSLLTYLIRTNGALSIMLRNPYSAFSYSLDFLLTIFFSIGIFRIIKSDVLNGFNLSFDTGIHIKFKGVGKRKKTILSILLVVLLLASFFSLAPQNFDGYAIPHYPEQARMIIPEYEYAVANMVSSIANNNYLLAYPGGFLIQNWTHGYEAYDILPELSPNALLIDGPPNELINYIYTNIALGRTNNSFAYYLYSLNIRYILVEGEVAGTIPGAFNPPNYPLILSHLNSTPDLSLYKKIGPDFIYEVSIHHLGPVDGVKLTLSQVGNTSIKDYLGAIGNNTKNGTFFSNSTYSYFYGYTVYSIRTSANTYNVIVNMKEAYSGPILVILYQTEDAGWILQNRVNVSHYYKETLNGVSQGFVIFPNSESLNLRFTIEYAPQHVFNSAEIGIGISYVAVSGILSYFAFFRKLRVQKLEDG